MTTRRRRLLIIATSVAVAMLLGAIAAVLTLSSDWFYNKVRERMIAEIERSTGGRVDIGAFHFDWTRLEATAGPLVVHGTEPQGESPLFRAGKVRIGLKILGAARSAVRLSSLIIERPRLHLIVQPDGSTNIPGPRPVDPDGLLRKAIDVGIDHFEFRQGVAGVNDKSTPFDIRGENLEAVLNFDTASRQYAGRIASDALRINSPRFETAVMSVAADLSIRPGRIQVSNARVRMERSILRASGVVHNLASPRGEFNINADFSVAEIGHYAPLPIARTGEGKLTGKLTFALGEKLEYELNGRLTARDLGWRSRDLRVSGISMAADMRVMPDRIVVPRFRAAALGGAFSGRGEIERLERFVVDGRVQNISIDEVNRLNIGEPLRWNGFASGAVRVEGLLERDSTRTLAASAQLTISPAAGPNPLQGHLDLSYDGRTRLFQIADAQLETGSTRLEFSGTVGSAMRLAIESRNLGDLTPALALVARAPRQIPIHLTSGVATIAGAFTGPLDNPRFTGRIALPAFTANGHAFDRLAAEVDATRERVAARNIDAGDPSGARLTGTATIDFKDWMPSPDSAFSAALAVRGVDVRRLSATAGRSAPIGGVASAKLNLTGTLSRPSGGITATIDKPEIWGESFDLLRANLRLSPEALEVVTADLRFGPAHVAASGAYRRTGNDWKNGEVTFQLSSDNVPVEQLDHVRRLNDKITGRLSMHVRGGGRLLNGGFEPASLAGTVAGRELSLNGARLGGGELSAEMKGAALALKLSGALRDTKIEGAGGWRLEGDYPGRAEIRFTQLSAATLRELGAPLPGGQPLPFRGFVEGSMIVSGPLDKPSALAADITLSHVEIGANPEQRPRAGARPQDLVLRNTEPVRLRWTSRDVEIQSARMAATDTHVEAAGRVAFNDKSPWDVTVRGGLNLAIFQLFNADLLARGAAILDARLHGPLRDPQVTGRLELRNASLYLAALPSGIDNANGVVTFDRDRASIQTLTAEVGGGRVALGGFVGFGGSVLLYGVQATAEQVRVRSADGATVTLNAALNLTGSSQKALISGGVTILKAGFAPRTDLGALLAERTRPIPTPASPNEYLRSVAFDVRIESGPGMEFETSLTHDIEAEAELRLRGDAARPVLVGDISITQGDIVLFGNKYEINRGEVRFVNPTRIEPLLDIDLQTKARGITVNISFTGTPNTLKMSYRSDPPLQTSDIIALLAVGRDPLASAGLASSQLATQSNIFSAGPNTIAQAMSAPASSRLQRFFGVSRLKIDPQLLGVENIPQARLTLEQQVSRDITITYVTNLSRTQEQIVRLEWDMNRQWSAVATREENGVFGVDFQYRKRFK
jgi:translocation and assembly module TamB